ncbi:MAG: hypothetical protein HRT69_15700 [Flavobacteriaceae bacterium]|nr:hypothetical protein [Flavobacteriaceae bacterium]
MNKQIILGFILFLIQFSVHSQNESKLKQAITKGNQISEKLTYEFDINSNDSLLIRKIVYNKNGKIIKEINYDDEGNVKHKFIYEEDDSGNITKLNGYKNGEIYTTVDYVFDKNGNRTENLQRNPDGELMVHQKRIYGSENQNTELHNKLRNKNSFYKASEYYYNKKNGKYSKIINFAPNGNKTYTSIYKYDFEKNMTEIFRKKNGKKELSTIFKYDSRNNLIERKLISRNRTVKYKYDSKNNLIEELNYDGDNLISKKRYYYKKFSA